jgi:alpha-ketoglutarate-dependent taurine dioxygenase
MISVRRLSPALGAEVFGVDLRKPDASAAEALRRAWLEHQVLVVRGQTPSEDELVAFGAGFGRIEKARKLSPLASRPEIMVVSNIRRNGEPLGALPDGEMAWHFDRIHQKVPNKAGVLYAVEVPARGGETRFASMCLAYERLAEATRARIAGLTALNTFQYGQTRAEDKRLSADTPSAVHPVVRTIPETGRKALYVCRLMTDRIMELAEAESRALLEELFDHVERPEFAYEHHWRPGDVLVWDNRCVIHARNDFDERERRLLKRVTVGDEAAPAP